MSQDNIHIKGARIHNLKNIEVKIPHGKITVITGLSGSGKSSLAIDTIFAEGQRRYIESLSAYARQFLGKLNKPDVEFIKGISPTVAIQQKVITSNPRSTVGTTTEIFDYLKLLFARIGRTYSPISNKEVTKHTVSDVIDFIFNKEFPIKIMVLSTLSFNSEISYSEILKIHRENGYVRIKLNDEIILIEDALKKELSNEDKIHLIVDRFKFDTKSDENNNRLAESIQTAFDESNGICTVFSVDDNKEYVFSNKFELDGISFIEPSVQLFSFNNPYGACKTCEGFGSVLGIDEDLVIPNKELSVYEGAVAPWKGEKMSEFQDDFIRKASAIGFPIHRPISKLTDDEYNLLWEGSKNIDGIINFFEYLESKIYKIYHRILIAKYRGKTTCRDCQGTRIRKDTSYIKINDKNISDILILPISDAYMFFKNVKLNEYEQKIGSRLLVEIQNRLGWLKEVGLGYLTLNRQANSLSGGESQRINLAKFIGSTLVGSTYILDEPSIGLHPRDTANLIHVLRKLNQLGNTLIIVEHEEAIMRASDEIIDIGPMAGLNGGELVYQGEFNKLIEEQKSLTREYLTGKRLIPYSKDRRKSSHSIEISNVRENNLKGISISIPLGNLVCITGVSGSGKSTLVKNIIYPAIRQNLGIFNEKLGKMESISGDLSKISNIELVDQNPIGRSSRSNPVTYLKAFDEIRELFSRCNLAKVRGYKPGFFSFNVPGGRCEVCEGEGQISVSMQFMADVHLVCESCKGKRYKEDTLEIKYFDKSIHDILEMTISEAYDFFSNSTERITKKLLDKIKPLLDVGLGYLKMGQPSSTLSGGEAQRIKLASFLLNSKSSDPTLFIFDEPSTGLHFYDIEKLLVSINQLIQKGHSVIIVEHDLDIIKNADYIIDLGPEGGIEGGEIVFTGVPEDIIIEKRSYTGMFLKEKLIHN